MTEQSSDKRGFLYRQGGNLLLFGLQAVVVMGVVLVVNSVNDKPTLPRSHEANFGDEVLVTGDSVGCPTEETYQKWLNTMLEKGNEDALQAAVRAGCRLVDGDTAGVVVKMSSNRLSGACVRPRGHSYCLWIIDSRMSVTNAHGAN